MYQKKNKAIGRKNQLPCSYFCGLFTEQPKLPVLNCQNNVGGGRVIWEYIHRIEGNRIVRQKPAQGCH